MEIDATNLIIAEELLSRGWNTIPIIKGQKIPAVDWKPYQEKRVTLDDLNEWFGGTDNEIAVVTGKISGITVIDLDKKGNVDGEKTATDRRLNLPEECSRKSPKGIHHYIKYNPDIKQTQGILDGIDIRNDGGYIKVWDFEGEYDWLNDSPPVDYTHELLKKKQPKSSAVFSQFVCSYSQSLKKFQPPSHLGLSHSPSPTSNNKKEKPVKTIQTIPKISPSLTRLEITMTTPTPVTH